MSSVDPDRPNILFVLTDDQGPWAMGCAGNQEIQTPVLDALASRGTRLESFFCASPVCSPARASLLTGQVPSTHGVHDYLRGTHVGPGATDYLEGQELVTDLFAEHGYRIGLSGKWHLGASDRPRPGFVHWYALEAGGSAYHDAPMFRGGEREPAPGYLTDHLADDAVQFIRAETDASGPTPFFLCLNFTAPHSPWAGHHPPEIEALYADCPFETCPQEAAHPWLTQSKGSPLGGEPDTRAALVGYFAAVTAMDRALGEVVSVLDELQLRESTLVVFASDNGFNAGHHGIWGKGNGTWPLNMYDSSVKVPAIISQPGRVSEGAVCDELLSAYDLAPTLLELAGLDPRRMEQGPGRSFASMLAVPERERVAVGEGSVADPRVVVFDEYGPVRMIRSRDWKYVSRWPEGPDELYHLAVDPGERLNLVDDEACEPIRRELARDLAVWFERHAATANDGRGLPVIGTGQAARVGQPGAFQGPLWDTAGPGNVPAPSQDHGGC